MVADLSRSPPDASVFPIEIYERILECVVETDPHDVYMWKYTLRQCSLVCRVWSWKCIVLRSRVIRITNPVSCVRAFYRLRRMLVTRPDLASLVEDARIRHEVSGIGGYSSSLELFPSVLGVLLTQLHTLRLFVGSPNQLRTHAFFRHTKIKMPSVTRLELNNVELWDSADLDWLLRPYPNVTTMAMHDVFWLPPTLSGSKWLPEPPAVTPPIKELQIIYYGMPPVGVGSGSSLCHFNADPVSE